jgi:hypothetical protein
MNSNTNFTDPGLGSKSNWENTGTTGGAPQDTTSEATSEKVIFFDDEPLWQDLMGIATQPDPALNGSKNPSTPYLTDANMPYLQSPTDNDPALGQKVLNQLFTFSSANVDTFYQQLQSLVSPEISNPVDEQEYNDLIVTDPEILKLAQESGKPAGYVQKSIQHNVNETFARLVNQDFPPDVADKLTFAYYVPDGAKNLSPELQAQLNSLKQSAEQSVAKEFGFSPNWQGLAVDSSDFMAKFNVEVNLDFEKLLQSMVDSGKISQEDATTLRSMHYGMAAGTSSLKGLLKQIESQVTAQLQAKYGFDVSYQPKTESILYNNIVNGDFAQTFQKNVAKYTGTATAEQKVLLQQYAANPKDPTIPDSIKQLAAQIASNQQLMLKAFPNFESLEEPLKSDATAIFEVSKTAIISKYNLNTTWNPTITALYPPGVDPATIQRMNNGINFLLEALSNTKNNVSSMPDSPEKSTFLDFLKVVGAAISKLQEIIYNMQISQTGTSKAMSRANLDMQLNDIAKQQHAADEVKAKVGKFANLGPLGKIFEWLIKIIMLIMSIGAGPMPFILVSAYFADSAVSAGLGHKLTFVQQFFRMIEKKLPPAAAAAINGLIAVWASISTLNPLLAMNLICQDSRCIQNIVKACGGSEQTAEMAAMIVYMTIMMALMIALVIVTGGAATPAMIGEMTGAMANALAISEKTAKTVILVSRWVFQAAITALTCTVEGVKMQNNILLAQIDIIKASAEAYSEIVQAIIKEVKKVLQLLFDLLSANSDNLTMLSNFQGKKWDDASQVMTNLLC